MFLKLAVLITFTTIQIKLAKTSKSTIVLVEYSPTDIKKLSHNEKINHNIDQYIEILANLSKTYSISIIVLPEITLEKNLKNEDIFWYASNLSINENPCIEEANYPKFVRKMSCAARVFRTVVVLSLIQERYQEYVPADVVFNSFGDILYRENQIGSAYFNYKPIAFEIPANRIFAVNNNNEVFWFSVTSAITGFKFSFDKMVRGGTATRGINYLICSNWISQLPFLTSLQVYQMWAQEMEVNVLFSGLNNPKNGLGGTGFYDTTGSPIFVDIVAKGGTQPYVYSFQSSDLVGNLEWPILENAIDDLAKNSDFLKAEKDPDFLRYETKLFDPSKNFIDQTICYNKHGNKHCCNFRINITVDSVLLLKQHYVYHLVAYKGPKTYYSIFEPGGVEICAIVACLDATVLSCGQRFLNYTSVGWPVTFQNLIITANFSLPRKEKAFFSSQFPNSLLSSMRPIRSRFTKWTKEIMNGSGRGAFLKRTFLLTEPQNRLFSFGIFGRNFTLTQPDVDNGAQLRLCSLCRMIIAKIIIIVFMM